MYNPSLPGEPSYPLNGKMGNLDVNAFASLLGTTPEEVSVICGDEIRRFDFSYQRQIGPAERATILEVLKALDANTFKASGPERLSDWEKGWRENLAAFVAGGYDVGALSPKYISKYPVSSTVSGICEATRPVI
ncbi:MAG: hypothetical protein HC888_07530 [Candidatus Competibacteraceae bacterium]|nr:hypothetical protein [Candidatus Competibacteraceae bacterium]